jgi:HEAT repeat protein
MSRKNELGLIDYVLLVISLTSLVIGIKEMRHIIKALSVFFICGMIWLILQFKRSKKITSWDASFNGAAPYNRDQYKNFRGRDDDIDVLKKKIQLSPVQLGVLYGESGIGKTSLVRAGLIPTLTNEKDVEDSFNCTYISMDGMSTNMESSKEVEEFIRKCTAYECNDLKTPGAAPKGASRDKSILFLDHFEQIYRVLPEEEQKKLVQNLEKTYTKDKNTSVMIILHENFLAWINSIFKKPKSVKRYPLKKFKKEDALQVIGSLENKDAILNHLKDRDGRIHPMDLSLVCSIMTNDKNVLDRHAYMEGGDKQRLWQHYLEAVLKGLHEKKALRILCSLIERGQSISLTLENISKLSGIKEKETCQLVEALVDRKLIRRGALLDNAEKEKYSLAHESLVFPICIKSGNVEAPVIKYTNMVNTRAEIWKKKGKDSKCLLKFRDFYKVRITFRPYLQLSKDDLKKFIRKHYSHFILPWILPPLVVIFALIGWNEISGIIEDTKKVPGYLGVLKDRNMESLADSKNTLREISRESIGLKLELLKGISNNDESNYNDEIMPTIFHTLIGISTENRDEILEDALDRLTPQNASKLSQIFTREHIAPGDRPHYQKKLLDTLEHLKDSKLNKTQMIANQMYIAGALGEIGDKDAVESLKILLLDSTDPEVKSSAAKAIRIIGNKEAIEVLIDISTNWKDINRSYAIGELKNINKKEIVDQLIPLLNEEQDVDVILAVVKLLRKIPDPGAVEPLKTILGKRNSDFVGDQDAKVQVRKETILALGEIGGEDVDKDLSKNVDKYLLELFNDPKNPNNKYKISLITAMGNRRIQDPEFVKTLEDLSKNNATKDKVKKITAVEALGKIANDDTVIHLLKLLKAEKDEIKLYILKALGNKLNEEKQGVVVEALTKLLGNLNSKVKIKIAAIEALGKIGHPDAVQHLVKFLKEQKKDPKDIENDVILCTVKALGQIGSPSVCTLPVISGYYENEADLEKRFRFLQVMMKLDPSNKKFRESMIKEIFNHPLVIYHDLKFPIIKTIEEAASKNFDNNMWSMLEWWEKSRLE